MKIAFYRVLQEALANSFKHANGASQKVTMSTTDGDLSVVIIDDGPGLDPQFATRSEALGLIGMRERVELLGGRFEIANRTPHGTRVQVSLPLLRGKHE